MSDADETRNEVERPVLRQLGQGVGQRPFDRVQLAQRLAPFVLSFVIAFAAQFFMPAFAVDWSSAFVLCALATGVCTVAVTYWVRNNEMLPNWWDLAPVFAYLTTLSLFRQAVHGVDAPFLGAGAVAILWLALYHSPAHYCAGAAFASALVIVGLAHANVSAVVWFGALERVILVLVLASIAMMLVQKIRAQRTVLAEMAITDPLTGAANARTWTSTMRDEMTWSRRAGEMLTVAQIRIDQLSELNENHGFQAGDAMLEAAARSWVERLRESDVLFRLRGAEFVVLLPRTSGATAVGLLDQLRRASPSSCTVGAATWDGTEDLPALMRRVASALSEARDRGGDEVVVAGLAQPQREGAVGRSARARTS